MSGLRRLKRKQNADTFGVSGKLFEHMTGEHVDVLQNIEFSLSNAYRHNRNIDDRSVAAALRAAITASETTNELSLTLLENLAEVRHLRTEVSDIVWTNALKVVLDSVGNHSSLQPGDRGYLEFISEFIR